MPERYTLCSGTLARVLLVALGAVALGGCQDRRGAFLEGRVEAVCDESWPVCDTVVGCLLGETSYLEGRLPGEARFALKLAEPSTVRVSVFLEDVGAVGDETTLTFHEEGCRSRIRESVSGRTFVGEAQEAGEFQRAADLTGVGDHLIVLASDAQARFLAKVEVVPKRSQAE